MGRARRLWSPDLPYHVIARANGGAAVFRSGRDYAEFLELIEGAWERFGAPALAYCLMPNHVHLVLRPGEGESLSRWMQWLLTRHAVRLNRRRAAMGAVWQARFRGFPIQEDAHLLTVLRYVERNALRAGLVERAQDWPWGSLAQRGIAPPPAWFCAVDLPRGWPDWVNEPQTAVELEAIRASVNRGAPFGAEGWRTETATALGLQATLRPRGRRTIGV
jgi:putative transposase